jgi:hypothetical protein
MPASGSSQIKTHLDAADLPIQLRCIVLTCSGQSSKFVEIVQQLFGVCGDLDEPLRDFAPFHRRVGAPAAARR